MFVQDLFRALERRPHRHRDQVIFRHDLADRNIETRFETQIAIGENTHQLLVFGDRNAGNLVLPHYFERVGDFVVRRHGHGIDDHSAFRPLDFVHFFRLLLNR